MFNSEKKQLKEQVAMLEARCTELGKRATNILADMEHDKNLRDKLQGHNDDLHKKNKELKEQLREQNEADILLNAFKAVGIIREEKEKPVDYIAEHNRLAGSLRNLGMGAQQGNTGGICNGLGNSLFGAFGL